MRAFRNDRERTAHSTETTELTLFQHLKKLLPLLLLTAYGVFLCSYFLFQDYSDPYRFFARVVFVLGLYGLISSFREIRKHLLFQAVVVYMVYLLLSGFWSDPLDWYSFGQKLTICAYLLSFLAITHSLVRWNRRLFQRMLQLCVMVAGAAALASIVVFYREHAFPGTRLNGIGSLTNSNEFSNVFGVYALLGMGFALESQKLVHRIPFLLAVAALMCFIWFGQSRTALLSLSVALLALVGLVLKERGVLYAAILAILMVGLSFIFPDVIEQAWLRGQGLRPQIWAEAWSQAMTAPVLGHGLISPVSIVADGNVFETLHNAYLQVFWQGGVIGLCLFLGLLACGFRNAWSWAREQGNYTVFCILLFAVCIMMTGVDTLIARPRDQWMLFWFPIALLLAYLSDTGRVRDA